MIKFNISPSALNLYKVSPLIFYLKYIEKAKPDTRVFTCYGNAGSIVHKCIERYCVGHTDFEEFFFKEWDKNNLDSDCGFNSSTLSKADYFSMAAKGIILVKDNYDIKKVENVIEIPHIEDDEFHIKVKGIIDFYGMDKEGKHIIADWKTGNSNGSDFEMHSKHYIYLIYKEYGIVIDRMVIHYLKDDKIKEYKFNEADLIEYEQELKDIINVLRVKGKDINKYDLGDIDWIFNDYKERCYYEKQKREAEIE
jgi:CRISPR/Cas system-associated exonuclease Cas4 (RecB family)